MPRPTASASAVREPLSYALATPAKVAALRALAGAGERITQRDVARRAGIQHRSIQLALNDLVALGVVTRIEGGRDYLVQLNDRHRLSRALRQAFAAEASHYLDLRQQLAAFAGRIARRAKLENLVLFGSAARGDDRLGSDCDVLAISRDKAGLDVALSELATFASELRLTNGCELRPIGYTVREAGQKWRRREPPFADVRRHGFVLFGLPLNEAFGEG